MDVLGELQINQRQFDVSHRHNANENLNREATRNITKREFFFVMFRG